MLPEVRIEEEQPAFILELIEQAEAKQMLITIVRSQQAYFVRNGEYSDNLKKLNLKIEQNHYEYILENTERNQFRVIARSKAPGVYGKGAGDDAWQIDHNCTLKNINCGCWY